MLKLTQMTVVAPLAAIILCCLSVAIASPAYAGGSSESGTKNCTGNGKIVPRVLYSEYFGGRVAVKQAGPPSSPTWGATLPQHDGSFPKYFRTIAYVSPYAEGTWSAYTPGPYMIADAQCSRKAAPSSTPTVSRSLGNKVCSSGTAYVDADGAAETWVMWKPSSSSTAWNRVRFSGGGINTVATRDASIYSVTVKMYGGEPQGLNRYNVDCAIN